MYRVRISQFLFINLLFFTIIFTIFSSFSSIIIAETTRTPANVGIDEQLGKQVNTKVPVILEDNTTTSLGALLALYKKPIVLIPSFYTCPHLCTYTFNGVAAGINRSLGTKYKAGSDYHVFSFSIDPAETQEQAQLKANTYRKKLKIKDKQEQALAWQFLRLKSKEDIQALSNSIGFQYKEDPPGFSHSAMIVFLSAQGKIIRYLYGVRFLKRDFRLALLEARENRVGRTLSERIMLYCFRYDLVKGKYAPHAWTFLRIGGLLTLFFLIALVSYLLYTKKR